MSKKRQLAAIVFTDITDFTSMMDRDESKALNIRHKQRDNIQAALKEYDGEYIKEIGDGDLMMFNSATDAVNFTLQLQDDIDPADNFSIRAAIHIGDVVREGDDIFGDGVNIASRIQGMAESGGICISQAVYDSIQSQADISAQSIGKHTLKGIDVEQELYTLNFSYDNQQVISQDDKKVNKKSKFNISYFVSWLAGILISVFIIYESVAFFTKPAEKSGLNSIAVFPFDNITYFSYSFLFVKKLPNLKTFFVDFFFGSVITLKYFSQEVGSSKSKFCLLWSIISVMSKNFKPSWESAFVFWARTEIHSLSTPSFFILIGISSISSWVML